MNTSKLLKLLIPDLLVFDISTFRRKTSLAKLFGEAETMKIVSQKARPGGERKKDGLNVHKFKICPRR